jgi:2-C-methyl-D-erythritol 2,4-cyclodiphosphate synthase
LLDIRVGIGFDVHPLVPDRLLVLGGVEVPFNMGLYGHSDGDVLVHAMIDAILGAAGLGDKGEHFPSTDPGLVGVSSLLLLSRVAGLLTTNCWRLSNVDATIVAERPVLSPFSGEMRNNIGVSLTIPIQDVSIKATTSDGLGFVGSEEGMAAWSVALVEKIT